MVTKSASGPPEWLVVANVISATGIRFAFEDAAQTLD
jgi:hypothetical protein